MRKPVKPPLKRLLVKCIIEPDTGCWRWNGGRGGYKGNYGRCAGDDGRVRPAHRFMYEQVYGPIPDGLEIDHVCQ